MEKKADGRRGRESLSIWRIPGTLHQANVAPIPWTASKRPVIVAAKREEQAKGTKVADPQPDLAIASQKDGVFSGQRPLFLFCWSVA